MNWGVAIPLLSAAMILAAATKALFDLYRGWQSWEKNSDREE